MTTWDWNKSPESVKEWQHGDKVWVDHTLYDVCSLDDSKVTLKRHEPITIRTKT